MSDRDIQLLAIGISIGMYLMLFLQMAYGIVDDRREARRRRQRERLDAADHFHRSLHRYQRQQRLEAHR